MRNIAFLKFPKNEVFDNNNYTKLFKDPQEQQLQNPEMVTYVQLEMTELGKYECFGEDYNNVSNFLLTPKELSKRHVSYTAISSMPVECLCIKKQDFYEYIDDIIRKKFMIFLRRYPRDFELRSTYYEKSCWKNFKLEYMSKHVPIPVNLLNDKRRMQEIQFEAVELEEK